MKQSLKNFLQKTLIITAAFWLLVIPFFIILRIIDVGTSAFLGLQRRWNHHELLATNPYADKPWAAALSKELYQSYRVNWLSYLYWRRRPYHGTVVNIDENGIRKTWNVDKPGVPRRVFLFGGSTMWGDGSRDEGTIPSCLSKIISKKIQGNVQVVNFGETGYVSTQEMIDLLLLLQKGNIPDIVIFYDGVNDVGSSLQDRRAGIPDNEENRRREFNLLSPVRKFDLWKEFVYSLFKNSSFLNSIVSGIQHFDSRRSHPKPGSESDDHLASEVAKVYASNVSLIKKLGRIYGFSTLCYWQPVIGNKKTITPFEKQPADIWGASHPFYMKVSSDLRHSSLRSNPDFHDISHLFDRQIQPLYLDFCHLSEEGNRLVAERIAIDLLPLLQKPIHDRSSLTKG